MAKFTAPITETYFSAPALETVSTPVVCPESGISAPEEPKTIKVIFYDTTAAFRADMKALTIKHSIKYGGLK